MSSDIGPTNSNIDPDPPLPPHPLMNVIAEREATIEQLRAALETIADVDQLPKVTAATDGVALHNFRLGELSAARIARAALQGDR